MTTFQNMRNVFPHIIQFPNDDANYDMKFGFDYFDDKIIMSYKKVLFYSSLKTFLETN